MVRFAEADARMFKNRFVCKRCKSAIKTTMMKVLGKKTACRMCKSRALRPKRKK